MGVYIGGRQAFTPTVGALGVGDRAEDRKSTQEEFPTPGTSDVFVCADIDDAVNESDEGNNCSKHLHFTVIPQRWNVSQFSTSLNESPRAPTLTTTASE
jgi:hypothetical protein